jgi:hypothetical protein
LLFAVSTALGFSQVPGSPFPASFPTWVAFSPGGGLLAVTSDVYGNVSVFSVNQSTGALSQVSGSPFTTGGEFLFSLAFSPGGGLLATGNEGDNVSVFSVNQSTGASSQVSGSPFAAGSQAAPVAFSPSGGLLATGNVESTNVSVFSVNQSTGALSQVSGSPFATGEGPYSVAFSPTGGLFATASNEGPGGVSVFSTVPEFGFCSKTARGSGRYSNSKCIEQESGGSYNFKPGLTSFTSAGSGGRVIIKVPGSYVECQGESGSGEITGDGVGAVTMTFSTCVEGGFEDCQSSGAPVGDIATTSLEGVLGIEKTGASNAKNKIGLDLFPVGRTGPIMRFSCLTKSHTIEGSLIAPIAADKMASTSLLKYSVKKGGQYPEKLVGEPADHLYEPGSPEHVTLEAQLTLTYKEKIEINTVY